MKKLISNFQNAICLNNSQMKMIKGGTSVVRCDQNIEGPGSTISVTDCSRGNVEKACGGHLSADTICISW